MKHFFEYNWQIRDEIIELCKDLSHEDLFRKRQGGLGSIAETFYHIIKVEHNWIRDLQAKSILENVFHDFTSFNQIIELSRTLRPEIKEYVLKWHPDIENNILNVKPGNGKQIHCTYGEAIRHIIAHEIHHVGQLSIWFREMGLTPVNSNLIHRGLFINNHQYSSK
ncbi:MAG: damage-inducible protein DinB [Flammeovirgaceae bacterium]|nr:damage-inducible protein DinB [Flammeovirgaceae bacterium]|tara:strand:- start:563 stop:1060 length:498 start_codon:yes stop_codon:yes gene_type:complete